MTLDNEDELLGIWADRIDITSVDEYVQSLRKGRKKFKPV